MNKIASGVIGVAVALSAMPFIAGAHETGEAHRHSVVAATTTGASVKKVRDEAEKKRQEVQAEAEKKRLEAKQEIEERRDGRDDDGDDGDDDDNRDEHKGKIEDRRFATSTATTTRQVFREEIKEKRASTTMALKEKREKFEDEAKKRMEELKKKFGEERAKRIEQYFKQMVEKFDDAIERYKKYADRIADFLEKAEANGKDVAALKAKLATANTILLAAETALEDAKAKYAEAAANPDFKARFAAVRTIVEGVAEKVKTSHRALVDVVNSIKGLGGGRDDDDDDTATTTPPTATTTPPTATTTPPTATTTATTTAQ